MKRGMSESFVHLQVHTQYSLLEGAIRMKPLFEKVKALGMSAIAITDTHNLFGAVDFYFAAKAAGVKPILGCDLLFSSQDRKTLYQQATGLAKGGLTPPRYFRLTVLCKDLNGYRNLSKLLTAAYLEAPEARKGEASGPRSIVDRELLRAHSEGLLVMTGGLRSEVAYHLIHDDQASAEECVDWLSRHFQSDLVFSIEDNGLPEQDQVNRVLYEWGKTRGILCAASANCHYLEVEDAEAQEVLQCIGAGRNLDFDRPQSLVPPEAYLKSATVMRERMAGFPGVCDATVEIANRCNVEFNYYDASGKMTYLLPDFRPEGVGKEDAFDAVAFFRSEAQKGLERRFQEPGFRLKVEASDWPEKRKLYDQRLHEELEMILRTGFAGYFLVVADFINWAKSKEIPVGPGRGSGAGSLVAYVLRITDLDPIEFNLLFERFINPERVSMPDFDVDFCQDRRGEVIDYVTQKYGVDNVSQIITFGKLQARAVLKDVGRVLGLTFAESDRITKLFPEELNITIQSALDREPQLRELVESDARVAKIMDYANKLEGLYRNAGVHAAGVIITADPIVQYCPLYKGPDGAAVTQLDKDFSEKIGLVKFDFLGLKTLTVIDNAVRLIRKGAEEGSTDKAFSIEAISYTDVEVFKLVGSGDTDGVFQVESSGMKDLCSRLQPNSIEDLTAINALYRPGPLGSGMVDDFIDRKHGRMPITYDVESLASILKDTYGVILYQEQVMQIARELAGYSLGQADMLRRAMGKKKADEMAKNRELFVAGSVKKGLPEAKAQGIFDLMAKFAEYGFNKSHSAAYAVLTYQTAFLKTYYPAEFMAALMTTEMSNTDKITKYISDARAHGIMVLSPDVNKSERKFGVEVIGEGDKRVRAIRFGLEAIKGVGGAAVDSILENRAENPYLSVVDFCRRVSTRKVNKKVLEALTLAGGFDSIAEVNRASIFASLEKLVEFSADEQEERELGQSSLFDSFGSDEIKLVTPIDMLFSKQEDWPLSKKLLQEKQVVGFFVSGHPMDHWQKIGEDWLGWNTEVLKTYGESQAGKPKEQAGFDPGTGRMMRPKRKELQILGLITESKEVVTKKGTRMAFVQLEDLRGKVEVIFFPDGFTENQERIKQALADAEPVVLSGEIEVRDEQTKILAKSIEWAKEAHQGRAKEVILHLQPNEITVEQLRDLKKMLIQNRGNCPITFRFKGKGFQTELKLPKTFSVNGNPKLASSLRQVFGRDLVEFR